jgi:HK97 family phage major capsid protein
MGLPNFDLRSLMNRQHEQRSPLLVVADSANTLTFSFSSEYPAKRAWGTEVLSHDEAAVDLSYLNSGAACLLWNHDPDIILGRVQRAWISGKRGYCTIYWSNSAIAQQRRAQVEEGVLSGVSCRYEISAIRQLQPGDDTVVATRWKPVEITLCAVPVDPTVGIGRSVPGRGSIRPPSRSSTNQGENSMTVFEEQRIKNEERDRIASLRGYGQRFNREQLAEQLIADGTPIEQARAMLLDAITNNQQPVATSPGESGILGLSARESKQYSLGRAIVGFQEKNWERSAPFEYECSVQLARQLGRQPQGILVPMDLAFPSSQQRATYVTTSPATGGNLVATELLASNFIDSLRNRSLVMQLGATMLTGLQANVDIPKRASSAQTYWVAEDAALTQSEGTFSVVSLRPKTVGCLSKFSRIMLLQSTPGIEELIRNDFAALIAIEIDRACISGTGASNQPRGILNTAGIGSVALGTNGAAPTWQSVVDLETLLANQNADVQALGYLVNSRLRGKLKNTLKPTPSTEFIWNDDGSSPPGFGRLNGYPAGVSNNVPSNLTKGSGTNLSAAIFANWADLLIGQWGALEILPNPYGAGDYDAGRIAVRAMITLDIAVRRPESFAAITDCITT